MKKRSSRFSRNRAILLGALLLAVGTLLICLCRVAMRSSQAALQKGLAGMEGCSVREVREAGPEKLGLRGIRVFGRDGSLFAIGSGSVDFRRLDSGRPPELVSIALQDFEIRRLDGFLEQLVLWSRAGKQLPEQVDLAGSWHTPSGAIPFRFRSRLKESASWDVRIELGDGNGLVAVGELRRDPLRLELKFLGKLAPELLIAAGAPLPPQIVPGEAEADGRLVWSPDDPAAMNLEAECALSEPWSRSGSFWQLRSGKRCRIGWTRSGWTVGYPDSELVKPFLLPIGELTFSGGEGSEIRFRSLGMEPPAGEQSGRFELSGRFDPSTGSWEFRQSEGSDRVVRWKLEHSFGELECGWRRPRISGSGVGERGEIDYSFGFDRFSCVPASDPQAFEAQPGSVAGHWRFDFGGGGADEELAGVVETARLEWPDPRTAWIAGRTRLAYRFSRQPGETQWLLELEPEAAGVSLVGADLPKLKLENLSGRFAARLDPAEPDRWPARVDASLEIARVELIATIFGAGMLRDVRLAGSGELGRAGSIRQHRLSGSIREARMRLGDLSATGEQINFDGVFDRNSMTPGDNHVTSLEVERIQVRSTNLNLESGRFRGRIAGELRGDDLLPRTWLVDGAFPSGSFTGRNLAGTFDGGSGRLRFASGRLDALEMLFSAIRCGAPADGAEDSRWKFTLPALSVAFDFADQTGWKGVARAEHGTFRGSAAGGGVLAAEELSFELPLASPELLPAPEGHFRVGRAEFAGLPAGTASGTLRQRGVGSFGFSGKAGRTEKNMPLAFEGEAGFRQSGVLESSGNFTLPPVRLAQPLALGVLPFLDGFGWTVGGEIGARGGWNSGGGRPGWSLELLPVSAEVASDGMQVSGVSGSIRLPSGEEKRPGGELSFRSLDAGGFRLSGGEIVFQLPDFDECDVSSGQANFQGGRAELAAPFRFRRGGGSADLTVRLDNFQFSGLAPYFELPPSLLAGRGRGSVRWRLTPGKSPRLMEATLSTSADQKLRLGDLEPLITANGEGNSSRQAALEALRDFDCRELQMRLQAEEEPGHYLLTVSAYGRPTRSISVGDEKVRRFLSRVDPAALGLGGPIRVSLTYHLTAKGAQ